MARRVIAKIEGLARQPRPRGCRKLIGTNRLWRVRVGEYRVVYDIDDRRAIVDVVIVRHRGDVYR
jgi:mRNA interferase RelE/StbE